MNCVAIRMGLPSQNRSKSPPMTLLRNVIVTLFVPVLVTVVIPYLILRSGPATIPGAAGLRQLAGAFVSAVGLLIACWCMGAFIFVGRGMPTAVDPPKRLVVHGLYRFLRNPMYSGVLLIIFGEAVCCGSALLAIYAALVWLALHVFVVRYEEPTLRRRFGEFYVRYCRDVPRWIPGLAKKG